MDLDKRFIVFSAENPDCLEKLKEACFDIARIDEIAMYLMPYANEADELEIGESLYKHDDVFYTIIKRVE